MITKFGRTYRITIDPKDGGPLIVIELPFTVQFWIHNDNNSNLNNLSIDIYNLSENTRSRIFQDNFDLRLDQSTPADTAPGRTIQFEIGYSTLYTVFYGSIFKANSSRNGSDIITRIESLQGIYDVQATQTFQTLGQDLTLGDILKNLIGQFPTLQLGAVGDYSEKMLRPVVLNGNVYDLIKGYTSDSSIVDGRVYILKNNEVLDYAVYLIDDSTGLLETPQRQQSTLTINMLLETGIKLNQLVEINSSVQRIYNGQYKVIGIAHQGMISSAVCGDSRTTLTLYANQFFREFNKVAAP